MSFKKEEQSFENRLSILELEFKHLRKEFSQFIDFFNSHLAEKHIITNIEE